MTQKKIFQNALSPTSFLFFFVIARCLLILILFIYDVRTYVLSTFHIQLSVNVVIVVAFASRVKVWFESLLDALLCVQMG